MLNILLIMGNRQGHQKEQGKSKADKKKDKEEEKVKKQKEAKEKKERKKRLGHNVSELDTDLDESSHVTGGDSESCVFHSAENVSFSPYLDSCTNSEHEQGAAWSGVFHNIPTTYQQPQVLSSKDFQDGFSLEACIPPEIARPETFKDRTPSGHRPGFSSSSMFRSDPDAEGAAPVTGDVSYSSTSQPSTTACVQKPEGGDSVRVLQSPSTRGFHHPHFYNHHYSPRQHQHVLNQDVQNLNKPSSPQPRRRALSLKKKMPFKSTSSDDSSSTPSSTTPARRAANFLALLKSGSKTEREPNNEPDKHTHLATEQPLFSRSFSNTEEGQAKTKSNPIWKTWERSRSKKGEKQPRISIFGTARKTEHKPAQGDRRTNRTENMMKKEEGNVKIHEKMTADTFKCDSEKKINGDKQGKTNSVAETVQRNNKSKNSVKTNSNVSSHNWASSTAECREKNHENSPSLSTTAAICILKLEELERSIEKTIREKFPDAEPFLLKKRSKEELRGSRSLPTTPSLQKKQYVVWKEDGNVPGSRLSDGKDATRFYDETFESPPSPAKSPVILRRFGARTRHASISPKIPRAKTAALYNSPSEMSRTASHFCTTSSTSAQHTTSSPNPPSSSAKFTKPLSASQKSESKYDNVSEEGDCTAATCPHHYHQIYDQRQLNIRSSDEAVESHITPATELEMVIIPSFSAVFGSVSPKLKRHFRVTFDEGPQGESSHLQESSISRQVQSNTTENRTGDDRLKKSTPEYRDEGVLQVANNAGVLQNNQRQAEVCARQGTNETVSVIECRKTINRFTSQIKAREPESEASECESITNVKVESNQHTPGQPSSRAERKPDSPSVRKHSHSLRTSPSAQVDDACVTELPGISSNSTSPGTLHKYSTDHVTHGSAGTFLSSHLSQTSPEPDETNAKKAHTEHAQDRITSSSRYLKFANKQQLSVCPDAETEHVPSPCQRKDSASVPDKATRTTKEETKSGSFITPQSVVGAVDQQQADTAATNLTHSSILSTNNEKQPHSSGVSNDLLNDVTDSSPRNHAPSVPLSADVCSEPADTLRQYSDLQRQHHQQHQAQGEQHNNKQVQERDSSPVLKQPVSEVISQMINLSKRQPPKPAAEQQQQQQQDSLSGTASSEYGMEHMKPVVAVVTTRMYEQSCRKLEEKTVLSHSSSPAAAEHPETCQGGRREYSSRCQEIQTDSYVTADKSVDSDDLRVTLQTRDTAAAGQSQNNVNPNAFASQRATEAADERKLFKRVLRSKKTQRTTKGTEDPRTSDSVPPPSPTAMAQLVEEFMEEEDNSDDDYDDDEKIRSTTTTKKEQEMKEFTDKIYKRLSDLLDGHSTDEDNLDNEVFVEDGFAADSSRHESTTYSRREEDQDSITSSNDETLPRTLPKPTGPSSTFVKVLTIETSSSLTTTTSSDSDIDEPTQTFQNFQSTEANHEPDLNLAEDYLTRKSPEDDSTFRGDDVYAVQDASDAGQKPATREYHSDDDVATGRGIPEYYDDSSLWTRRQKPPGRMSATMQAIRTRERRERWLKKRLRNKTDLLSTGSSDTGSEFGLGGEYSRIRDISTSFDSEKHENQISQRSDLGSGILTSPKYTKPILPFFDGKISVTDDGLGVSVTGASEHTQQLTQRKERGASESNSDEFEHSQVSRGQNIRIEQEDVEDSRNGNIKDPALSSSEPTAPGIEDTFLELQSVQNILAEMQNWHPTVQDNSQKQFMPLTTENVRTIREYYKECYMSGRRSRMSIADRTESDLDLCSEARDDASSDSNVYADDEEDEDGLEPYATAEDDLGATGGNCSADSRTCRRSKKRDKVDNSNTDVVLSCTFYNSNTHPPTSADSVPQPAVAAETRTTHRSTSASRPAQESDDEFWAGSAAGDESYRQLETAADTVSSTFQNAREQMHDIQYHLQALRRQMEIMHDDLTSTSMTLTPNTSLESTGK